MSNEERPLPPAWPIRILRQLCSADVYEIIEGDLLEQFQNDVAHYGTRTAKRRYVWNAVGFFVPSLKSYTLSSNYMLMLGSYLNIARRHVVRSKLFSFIHVLGLSMGMATFMGIALYVSFERSFDQCYGDDRIYRVAYEHAENGDEQRSSAKNLIGIPSVIKEYFPEVKACTAFDRTAREAHFLFRYNGRRYFEQESFYQTDSSFFLVFSSLLVLGDPATVLSDPHNLVISQKVATKIFGKENPIGKTIQNGSSSYSDVSEFVIAGVMRDMPANAHVHVNFIARNSHTDETAKTNYWSGPKFYTYVSLSEHADPTTVSERLNAIVKKISVENTQLRGARMVLQPVSDIHLRSNLLDELEAPAIEKVVNGLWIIAIIIIVMAWINYVNIETARFATKLKEVGVRRIVGSTKGDLALQFLIEYTLLAGVALSIANALLWMIAPSFYEVTGIRIGDIELFHSETLHMAVMWLIGGSFFAGIYPAVFLLKINPIQYLRTGKSGGRRGMTVRRALMIVQFMSVLFLVAFLLVVYDQLHHLQRADQKMTLNRIVSIRNPSVYTNEEDSINFVEFELLKQRLLENPHIEGATSASVIPGMAIEEYVIDRLKMDLTAPYDPTRYRLLFIDYDFIPFYSLRLKAGRNYSMHDGDEENWNKIILNESAVKALGFANANAAVDKQINFHLWGDSFEKYTIVGVVEDYHQESIKEELRPTILSLNHGRFQQVFYSIKLNEGSNPKEGLALIEEAWKKTFPDKPFDYFFQDVFYDQQFKSEVILEKVMALLSGVALIIASLGVLGMAVFEANARMREVSIRKVLGATRSSIVALLSREFMIVLVVASCLAIPLAYYCSHEWLLSYASHIDVKPIYFVMPWSGVLVLIAIVCGSLMFRTANANIVDHLKDE